MLQSRNKQELTQCARDICGSLNLLSYQSVIYVPADFETLDVSTPPSPDRRVWLPLSYDDLILLGNQLQQIMFTSEKEKASYLTMVQQAATPATPQMGTVLLSDGSTLFQLTEDGTITKPTQNFVPHYIHTPINHDQQAKDEVMAVITDWLGGSEDDARSLLHHIATALAPHWPAVKYVLLIGEGRNGKSVLMKMIQALLGKRNVSHVTRQDMSSSKPTCLDLANRLANIIYDGPSTYLKDSGPEKSLIAGDPTPIRRLYMSSNTDVQTNGLFIEGLNREPKTGDKSSALQKRLVRFHFSQVYELNHVFEKHMLSTPMLGAFLSLLIDHYVKEAEVSSKLKPTRTSRVLQLEQMFTNSLPFQYLAYYDETDALGLEGLVDEELKEVVDGFKQWRITAFMDMNTWNDKDVEQMFRPLFTTARKSKRINGRPRHVLKIEGFSHELTEFIKYIRGEEDASEDDTTVVADGPLHPEPVAAASQP